MRRAIIFVLYVYGAACYLYYADSLTINVRRISPSITTAIPFFAGYRMTYMQRGNYVAVINPLSYSEVMSDDPDLSRGVYDTVTDTFSLPAEAANIAQFAPLIRGEASTFQQDDRFYTIVHSENVQLRLLCRPQTTA